MHIIMHKWYGFINIKCNKWLYDKIKNSIHLKNMIWKYPVSFYLHCFKEFIPGVYTGEPFWEINKLNSTSVYNFNEEAQNRFSDRESESF